MTGGSMTSFAVVLQVWDLSRSSLAVGLLGLTFVPVLFVGLLGGAVVLLAAFLAIESRVSSPLMPLRLFKLRNVATANVVGVMWAAAMFAWFFLSALYMQRVLNYGAAANWAFARIGAMTGSNAESSLEAFGNAMRDRRWIENVASDTEVAGILDRVVRDGEGIAGTVQLRPASMPTAFAPAISVSS